MSGHEQNPAIPPSEFVGDLAPAIRSTMSDPDRIVRLGCSSLGELVDTQDVSIDPPEVGAIPKSDEITEVPLRFGTAGKSMHLYDTHPELTVEAQLYDAKQALEPTPHQVQLIRDTDELRKIAPRSYMYADRYTPDEIHQLVTMLDTLRQKNREDFTTLEGRMIDYVSDNRRTAEAVAPGISLTVHQAQERCRDLTWRSLARAGTVVIACAHDRMTRINGGRDYIFDLDVKDSSGSKPDMMGATLMAPIYQAAAHIFAADVLAERTKDLRALRCQAYEENCRNINEWFAVMKPVIRRLPMDFMGDVRPARWELESFIELMNERLVGGETKGKYASYKYDPTAALKLQQKIKHFVTRMKKDLHYYRGSR